MIPSEDPPVLPGSMFTHAPLQLQRLGPSALGLSLTGEHVSSAWEWPEKSGLVPQEQLSTTGWTELVEKDLGSLTGVAGPQGLPTLHLPEVPRRRALQCDLLLKSLELALLLSQSHILPLEHLETHQAPLSPGLGVFSQWASQDGQCPPRDTWKGHTFRRKRKNSIFFLP